MNIVIDTREQLPYDFPYETVVKKLHVGDYSIQHLEDNIAIERKTLDDLIACLTRDRERFKQCLQRGKGLNYFAVVVEASLSDIVNGYYRSQAHPKSMLQSLMAFTTRYKVPIFFAETREFGQLITESLLEKYARGLRKRAR
jgi:ERCC4-type nuclease